MASRYPNENWEKDSDIGREEKKVRKEEKEEQKLEKCEFCNQQFPISSLLKHIGHNEKCKLFYGSRFELMKKECRKKTKENYKERQRQKYDEDPEEKRKKKQYYEENKEYIKSKEKEKYDKEMEEKEAKIHAEYLNTVADETLSSYKEEKFRKIQNNHENGYAMAKELFERGLKAVENFDLIRNAKEDIKAFENEIEETYTKFQGEIDLAVESSKKIMAVEVIDNEKVEVKGSYEKVDDILKNLDTNDFNPIYDKWHSLMTAIDVKFMKIAKEMGKKYCGSMCCKCYPCQMTFGRKNIQMAHKNRGFFVPDEDAFEYHKTKYENSVKK